MDLKSRLDLTQVFCDVDDFYKVFQRHCETLPLLTSSVGEKLCTCRSKSHRVFEGLVGWGKNSVGWHYGFKLHLVKLSKRLELEIRLTPNSIGFSVSSPIREKFSFLPLC